MFETGCPLSAEQAPHASACSPADCRARATPPSESRFPCSTRTHRPQLAAELLAVLVPRVQGQSAETPRHRALVAACGPLVAPPSATRCALRLAASARVAFGRCRRGLPQTARSPALLKRRDCVVGGSADRPGLLFRQRGHRRGPCCPDPGFGVWRRRHGRRPYPPEPRRGVAGQLRDHRGGDAAAARGGPRRAGSPCQYRASRSPTPPRSRRRVDPTRGDTSPIRRSVRLSSRSGRIRRAVSSMEATWHQRVTTPGRSLAILVEVRGSSSRTASARACSCPIPSAIGARIEPDLPVTPCPGPRRSAREAPARHPRAEDPTAAPPPAERSAPGPSRPVVAERSVRARHRQQRTPLSVVPLFQLAPSLGEGGEERRISTHRTCVRVPRRPAGWISLPAPVPACRPASSKPTAARDPGQPPPGRLAGASSAVRSGRWRPTPGGCPYR